ncbi:uncharacterized protein LOC106460588 [Limulus polyphemus]|uniref:Uncharacterized protein LOC106460588 n=1 Tax=Limulus polyphemus TaxID=6850 RepID=A0ABM1B6F8_LIMPO|nr:uncharacterized protein LOC106460588 [Limulus polyphemus]
MMRYCLGIGVFICICICVRAPNVPLYCPLNSGQLEAFSACVRKTAPGFYANAWDSCSKRIMPDADDATLLRATCSADETVKAQMAACLRPNVEDISELQKAMVNCVNKV